LTLLPTLNVSLEILNCSNNQLTTLPNLNLGLQELYYYNNPIYKIIDGNNLFIVNNKIQILHKFCHLYYSLKFKKQFRDFLWKKIREPQIIQKYHPSYLNKLLIDDAEGTEDLDMVLNSWL
jgi:Leucine-rich repeat (LRR) protein